MKGNLKLLCTAAIVLIGVSCQAIFTFSPFSFLQRDIADLPPEQQINWANDALASGDTTLMLEAYDAILALLAEGDDPALSLLAADLAFGGSGITDVFTGLLSDPENVAPDDLLALLDALDVDLISDGAAHIQDAEDGGATVTDDQYVIAGAALLASAAEAAGGFDALDSLTPGDPGYDDYQDAQDFLDAGGAVDFLDLFAV